MPMAAPDGMHRGVHGVPYHAESTLSSAQVLKMLYSPTRTKLSLRRARRTRLLSPFGLTPLFFAGFYPSGDPSTPRSCRAGTHVAKSHLVSEFDGYIYSLCLFIFISGKLFGFGNAFQILGMKIIFSEYKSSSPFLIKFGSVIK